MKPRHFDKILDKCIDQMAAGRSISDCLKKYPKTRGLKQALMIVQTGLKLPKKQINVDKAIVWKTIQSQIHTQSVRSANLKQPSQEIFNNPFGAFRFAFSKTIFSLVTVIVIVGLVNVTAVAAKNSLPGQALYPVKKTVEKIELVLTVNEEKKTEKKIKHAGNRLYEAQQIVEENAGNENETLTEEESKVVEETITELVDTTKEIIEESKDNKALLEQVVELTEEQKEVLVEIEPKITGDSSKEIVGEAIESAADSKIEAEVNLALLEEEENPNTGDETATSTEEIIEADPEGEVEGTIIEIETSTSTEDIIEILGDPQASSTKIFIPFPNNETVSSTPEIIDLK